MTPVPVFLPDRKKKAEDEKAQQKNLEQNHPYELSVSGYFFIVNTFYEMKYCRIPALFGYQHSGLLSDKFLKILELYVECASGVGILQKTWKTVKSLLRYIRNCPGISEKVYQHCTDGIADPSESWICFSVGCSAQSRASNRSHF